MCICELYIYIYIYGMIYFCEKCGYNSIVRQSFERHLNKMNPCSNQAVKFNEHTFARFVKTGVLAGGIYRPQNDDSDYLVGQSALSPFRNRYNNNDFIYIL